MAWKLIPSELAEYTEAVALAKGREPKRLTLKMAVAIASVDRNILSIREWACINDS